MQKMDLIIYFFPHQKIKAIQFFQHFVPLLLLNLEPAKDNCNDGLLTLQTLSTLTNIAALSDWHQQFTNGLHR